jgi:hypothetical protein
VLVFSWNFSDETTVVLPRWKETFSPWEITTKMQTQKINKEAKLVQETAAVS